jgi:nitrite reductase/ring-hydroxylating ferredoxin subunit
MAWKAVGPEDMLADGQMAEVQVDGTAVLLARVDGAYYATAGLCAHMGGHLARGKLKGFVVICPRHGSQYDVRDGSNLEWIPKIPGVAHRLAQAVKGPRAVQSHATRTGEGRVWVEMP